jgi:hypothetical protein
MGFKTWKMAAGTAFDQIVILEVFIKLLAYAMACGMFISYLSKSAAGT